MLNWTQLQSYIINNKMFHNLLLRANKCEFIMNRADFSLLHFTLSPSLTLCCLACISCTNVPIEMMMMTFWNHWHRLSCNANDINVARKHMTSSIHYFESHPFKPCGALSAYTQNQTRQCDSFFSSKLKINEQKTAIQSISTRKQCAIFFISVFLFLRAYKCERHRQRFGCECDSSTREGKKCSKMS